LKKTKQTITKQNYIMKNKIAIASAFLAASSFSFAEIALTENISVEGFVDMSYSHSDAENGAFGPGSESDNSFGIDQVEIDWLFNFGNVSAQVDLEYEEGVNGTNVEQAFVNYALASGDVVTAGRYATMLGFEALEPTGMYQFSGAYTVQGNPLTAASDYVQGVRYTRTSGNTFFGISLQDQAFGNDADRLGGDVDPDSSYAVEVAASMDLGNGFTVFVGGAFENAESGDNDLINAYVTYETGAWLFAAELNSEDNESINNGLADFDITSYMLMANYTYSDVASVTGRVSAVDIEVAGNEVLDGTKLTLAHNYAFSDNLALCAEVSLVDGDVNPGGGLVDAEVTSFALEMLFTF
jgi:hypothetical protein